MKEIKLNNNKVAFVDDDDYEYISQWKWSYHNSGYAMRRTSRKLGKRKTIYMHRVINHTQSNMHTDHIDRDGLNNQKHNLRNCTSAENKRNRVKSSNNTTGYKGDYKMKALTF